MPIALGGLAMAAGLVLPIIVGGLLVLFVSPAVLGVGHIYFHFSIHILVGSLGTPAERTKNFSTFALGASIAAFIGPSAAGFAIELAGYRAAFAMLAVAATLPSFYVFLHRRLMPNHVRHEPHTQAKSALDLLAIPPHRRTPIRIRV